MADLEIRPLRTHLERQACHALQRETWGADFNESVPPSILLVSQRLGGVATGAFDAAGRLVGFVFGMTGVERGRIVHWSDMLAVRPEARNSGLGQRLKDFQRREALAAGATLMYWSFDPLVQRNAHLNLVRLGARVTEYVEDMYGDTGSELHRGLGTDRLVVAWELEDGASDAARSAAADAASRASGAEAPVINALPRGEELQPFAPLTALPDAVRIAVPPDIAAVQARSTGEAGAWRRGTRAAFQWALGNGYAVTTFIRAEGTQAGAHGSYLLRREAR